MRWATSATTICAPSSLLVDHSGVVAAALLDRLLHHAVVVQIEGSSYRLPQQRPVLLAG